MQTQITGTLGFTHQQEVLADTERNGRLRTKTPAISPYTSEFQINDFVDFHECPLHDCALETKPALDLATMGFDMIDLSRHAKLQYTLEKIRASGSLSEADEKSIRRNLIARAFSLSNGKQVRLLFIANEGLIIRKSGPNGMKISTTGNVRKNNGQPAAALVHGDQDVYGNPVKRLLKGAGPWLFRHQSPDGENHRSPLMLVNLWIPLQQVTMPLCLMDRRTLNNQQDQLRFALPVTRILDRQDSRPNDIWTFLHNDNQRWYFNSTMTAKNAYIFDTLGMPHGAAVLPGENVAEEYYLRLQQACDAIQCQDLVAFTAAVSQPLLALPPVMTLPLRTALQTMEQLFKEAIQNPEKSCKNGSHWHHKTLVAMDSVIRKSIELRAVGLIT